MKITQEEVVERQTVLLVELEDEELDPYLDKGYRRVVQRTVIPGFRKGKAPRRIIEQYLGRESLINEVIDTMLPEVTNLAITQQELDAAGLPKIELLELDPFSFKATVPLTPGVDLGDYKEIRIDEESIESGEDDVNQRIEQIQQGMASWEPVERPVEFGDMVTMVGVGTVDDKNVLDDQDTVYFLDEDSVRPYPGFSEQLIGMETDEPKEFQLTIPEDHLDTTIAGQEAQFTVTVSEIKERNLPALDDEFAQGVGEEFETFEDLKKKIEEDVRTEAESSTSQQHREAIIAAMLEIATIELPPTMVDHEVDHMEENHMRMLQQIKVRADDYYQSIGKSREDILGEMREEVVNRLNRTFLLAKVAEVESLEIPDDDVAERIGTMFADTDESPPEDQADELNNSIRRVMVAEKTMEHLVSIAKGEAVYEKEPQEASAEEEPTEDVEDAATDQEENTNQNTDQGEDPDDKQA